MTMKKKLLFVLMLFVSLTGFKNREEVTSNSLNVSKELYAVLSQAPVITRTIPRDGEVKCFEGQIMTFAIEFVADASTEFVILKDGEQFGSGNISKNQDTMECTIKNVKIAHSGEYKIVLWNKVGTAEAKFNVKIYPNE